MKPTQPQNQTNPNARTDRPADRYAAAGADKAGAKDARVAQQNIGDKKSRPADPVKSNQTGKEDSTIRTKGRDDSADRSNRR